MKAAGIGLAVGFTVLLASAGGAAAPGEKMLTATGTVTKLQASERAVFVTVAGGSETRFVWSSDTKINGTLSQGAKVTVRYTEQPDGQNLARQISVSK